MDQRLGYPGALPHLRVAKDLMDRHYAELLSLDDVALQAGYSRFHFLRAFRQAYGETPRAYLTRRRIERARDLLRSANLTVAEICHMVGWICPSGPTSWGATFRKPRNIGEIRRR